MELHENTKFYVTGYTDEYFSLIDGHGNSGYQYSLIKETKIPELKTKYGEGYAIRKIIINASSFNELLLKLAVCGLKLKTGKNLTSDSSMFEEYEVEMA